MATATQNSDSSKGSNGKSVIVDDPAELPAVKVTEEKRPEVEAKSDEKKDEKKAPRKSLFPNQVADLLREKAEEFKGDKFAAAAAVMTEVVKHRKAGYFRGLLAPVSKFVCDAHKAAGKSTVEAALATGEWMEKAQRPPKFTPETVERQVARALKEKGGAQGVTSWAFGVAMADERISDQEAADIAAHLVANAPMLGLDPEQVAHTLLIVLANAKCSHERAAAVKYEIKPAIAAGLIMMGVRLSDAQRTAQEVVSRKYLSREEHAEQRNGNGRRDSRPRGNMPQPRVVQEATPNDGRRGGRLPKNKRAVKAEDRKPKPASKPKPEGNGKGGKRQKRNAAIAANAN